MSVARRYSGPRQPGFLGVFGANLPELPELPELPDGTRATRWGRSAPKFIASYRGTVAYVVKARVDYILFYGGWQTLVDGEDVTEGNGRTWRVDHPGTWNIDVKGHVREADNNGWHACLKETL